MNLTNVDIVLLSAGIGRRLGKLGKVKPKSLFLKRTLPKLSVHACSRQGGQISDGLGKWRKASPLGPCQTSSRLSVQLEGRVGRRSREERRLPEGPKGGASRRR